MFSDVEAQLAARVKKRQDLYSRFSDFEVLNRSVDLLLRVIGAGGRVLSFGNGGSAAQSSHFTAEFVNRFYFDRPGIAAVSLTADPANLTSIGNDSDFKFIFSRQIEAIGQRGDLALGLSTSGISANVLEALKAAKKGGLYTMALCGSHTIELLRLEPDCLLSVPADDTALVQEMHLFFLHILAELVEARLYGTDRS